MCFALLLSPVHTYVGVCSHASLNYYFYYYYYRTPLLVSARNRFDRQRGLIALAMARLTASCEAGGGEVVEAMRARCFGVSDDLASIGTCARLQMAPHGI